jgi:general stress protein 26
MTELSEIAPQFIDIAHRIVWATVATVDATGRPWTRILHPVWEWDGDELIGWIASGPASLKAKHLAANPRVSLTYWDPTHDTATAAGEAAFVDEPERREWLWERFKTIGPPVGYDPAIIPGWTSPQAPGFGALRVRPDRLRVLPGSGLVSGQGETSWKA